MLRYKLANLLKSILNSVGVGISSLEKYNHYQDVENDIRTLWNYPDDVLIELLNVRRHSKSQSFQDLFVLLHLNFKEGGFFVDFGGTDGISANNTVMLEERYNWNGIIAEAALSYHESLKANRRCFIETNCVWSKSGEKLIFNETDIKELSTIDSFSFTDGWRGARQKGFKYEVDTISLMDMLSKYNAPEIIDYLSIDTEGSEYEILASVDYSKYNFRVITCEHNFNNPMRDKIFKLLSKNGYKRMFKGLSAHDDWYVLDLDTHLH